VSDAPLVDFVMAIGAATFADKALVYVNSRLAADHISLFVLDHEFVPHLLGGASRDAAGTALRAGRIYERSLFYRHDPNSRRFGGQAGAPDPATGDVMIFRQRSTDIRDPQYRDRLYRRFGLQERLSAIRNVHGTWFVCNVYRSVGSGSFTGADLDALAHLGPLLVSCTARHAALAAPAMLNRPAAGGPAAGAAARDYLEGLLGSVESRLTRRERQVCALALADHTVAEIAATLGIGRSTVATLRRRAYAKLGISRLNGLFALCIERITQ
jgi:DNA-binding CsgD family transcriptional regulator